jgi:hypothetical protein
MTYPVDDAGNVRIDFVWGHMPVQPDQQRTSTSNNHYVTDGDWTISKAVGSGTLDGGWTTTDTNRSDGWQNEINRPRYDIIDYGSSAIALSGYSNYPAFIENYSGDGDIGLEAIIPDISNLTAGQAFDVVSATGIYFNSTTTHIGATVANNGKWKSQDQTAGDTLNIGDTLNAVYYAAPTVPNLIGLNIQQVGTALTNAHLVGANTMSTAGATQLNNGLVKSQATAAGTVVNTGSTVNYVLYNYVVTANTNIAGFSQNSFPGHAALTGQDAYIFLFGRTTKPAVGQTITVANATNSSLNRNYTVNVVEDNDSYNTGGTVLTVTAAGTTPFVDIAASTGATWVVA